MGCVVLFKQQINVGTNVGANVGTNVGVNVGTNVGVNDEKVLVLLANDGALTIKTLAATIGITPRQVERIIAKHKKEGVLVRHGASKNGYWEVLR